MRAALAGLRHFSVPIGGASANRKKPLKVCISQWAVPLSESPEPFGLKTPNDATPDASLDFFLVADKPKSDKTPSSQSPGRLLLVDYT